MTDKFDTYKINTNEIICKRLTSYFKQETDYGIDNLIYPTSNEVQEASDINIKILESYDIDCSTGKLLDNIGKLIGLPRAIENTNIIEWFSFDDNDLTFDSEAGCYVSTANKYNVDSIDDETYRQRLRGQAFKNHTMGSIPEFYIWCKKSYNLDVSLMRSTDDNREFYLLYDVDTLENLTILDEITNIQQTRKVKNEYFSPIPAGYRITGIMPITKPAFGFDRFDDTITGFDNGLVTILIRV